MTSVYSNHMTADETPDRVRAAYGASKYERLAQLKAEYDPTTSFYEPQHCSGNDSSLIFAHRTSRYRSGSQAALIACSSPTNHGRDELFVADSNAMKIASASLHDYLAESPRSVSRL